MALDFSFASIETIMLATVRFAAFLFLAPPFSQRAIPGGVKAALSLGLGILVAPRLSHVPSQTAGGFIAGLVMQAVIGAALGFLVLLALAAVRAAGSMIDLFGGFQLASAYDPLSGGQAGPFARFYYLTAGVLLFASNAHHLVITGVVRTFDSLPLGVALPTGAMAQSVTSGVTNMLVAALQIAGPLMIALFVADVGLGLLTRVAPALNAFAIGFPLKILVTLTFGGFAFLALGAVIESLTGRSFSWMGGLIP
jgi:flagellar biosynthetic protein FliR